MDQFCLPSSLPSINSITMHVVRALASAKVCSPGCPLHVPRVGHPGAQHRFQKKAQRAVPIESWLNEQAPWTALRAGRHSASVLAAADNGRESAASNAEKAELTTATSTLQSIQSAGDNMPESDDLDVWFTTTTMLQLLVLMLGLGYAGVPLLAQLLSGLHSGGAAASGLDQAAALCLVEGAMLLGVRGLLQRRLSAKAAEGHWVPRLEYRWDPHSLALGLGAGAAALLINNAAEQLLAGPAQRQSEAMGVVGSIMATHDWLAAALLFVGSSVLAPATEEAAYRGFLLPSLQRALPVPPAVASVAAVFAAAHLEPTGLGQLAVVGVCLGTAAVASGGNLAAPTAGHMLYNASLFLSLALAAGGNGG